jgi:hypothetical protein
LGTVTEFLTVLGLVLAAVGSVLLRVTALVLVGVYREMALRLDSPEK